MTSFKKVENTNYPVCVDWYVSKEAPRDEQLEIFGESYYALDDWKMRAKFLQLSITDPILQVFVATAATLSEVAMGILNGFISIFSGDIRQLWECARLIIHAATIPFALIALEASALLGMITPHYARVFYTKVEGYIYEQHIPELGAFFKFSSNAFGPVKNVNEYQLLLEREEANPKGGLCHFVKQFCANPGQMGSLVPSSRALALEMISMIVKFQARSDAPIRILEAGAGTGSFTEEVVRKLRPQDQFDVVELEAGCCDLLKKIPVAQGNVQVHDPISILDYQLEYGAEKYDLIISGIPLHALNSPEFADNVYKKYLELAKEGAVISQFEYMGLPKMATLFYCGEEKEKLLKILEIKNRMMHEHSGTVAPVYWNFTPAQVLHFKVADIPK